MAGNTLRNTFWAHSDRTAGASPEPSASWQPLREHLCKVGELAEQLALACSGDAQLARRAKAAGLLHDLGKYRQDFQKLLRGEVQRAPHSVYGAAAAYQRAGGMDVAFAVAGHHGGMPDSTTVGDRIKEAAREIEPLWRTAVRDCPELAECFSAPAPLLGKLSGEPLALEVQCRMMLSCLVDADRTDTARHAGDGVPPSVPLDATVLLDRLLQAIETRAGNVGAGAVKSARATVLQDCLEAATKPGPFFSLTVPTGGGKTLAGMAFALRRAALRPELRRVIVVIPYLSIIEQNAAVYREALGVDILEHHSAAFGLDESNEDGYQRLAVRAACENWDAPIVVTTSVRFFETLFSNHPRDLRRLHNIARSVVILDEVQTLPSQYLHPTLSMMEELGRRWGVTFVYSTATQPAFEKSVVEDKRDLRWNPGTLTEISSDVPRLFANLRRVSTDWRPLPMSWEQVAEVLSLEAQVLVIVNTRRQARMLTEALLARGGQGIHLSTNLCPSHRRKRLEDIRGLLREGLPCVVVSTQLVEAGVDLDFPVVWRALGPLDSIAQAAGRCDREGRLTARLGSPGGRLVVFVPEDDQIPRGEYERATKETAKLFRGGNLNWELPETIRTYFHRIYEDTGDSNGIQDMRKSLQFAKVAAAVNWIDAATWPVLVPYEAEAAALIREFRFAGVSLGRFRRAQQYTVNLRTSEFERARAIGSVNEIAKGVWACPEGLYDEQWGIQIEGRGGVV